MSTDKTLSRHHYYQIAAPIISSNFLCKNSDSITNIDLKIECQQKQKQVNKTSKMKKSQIATITDCETKSGDTSLTSTSMLRRRFSLFRSKRSNIQALHQTIDQLKRDLQTKTNELETMKDKIGTKQNDSMQPSNESIEQAMQLQTVLNAKLEEMITENDLLKKSIQELESFAQQQKSKTKKKEVHFYQ
jgi:hypothetical protein